MWPRWTAAFPMSERRIEALRRLTEDERPILALLAALSVLPAVLVGGVHPGTQILLLVLVAALLLLLRSYREQHPRRTFFTLPKVLLLAAMILGATTTFLQLVPLP